MDLSTQIVNSFAT